MDMVHYMFRNPAKGRCVSLLCYMAPRLQGNVERVRGLPGPASCPYFLNSVFISVIASEKRLLSFCMASALDFCSRSPSSRVLETAFS